MVIWHTPVNGSWAWSVAVTESAYSLCFSRSKLWVVVIIPRNRNTFCKSSVHGYEKTHNICVYIEYEILSSQSAYGRDIKPFRNKFSNIQRWMLTLTEKCIYSSPLPDTTHCPFLFLILSQHEVKTTLKISIISGIEDDSFLPLTLTLACLSIRSVYAWPHSCLSEILFLSDGDYVT